MNGHKLESAQGENGKQAYDRVRLKLCENPLKVEMGAVSQGANCEFTAFLQAVNDRVRNQSNNRCPNHSQTLYNLPSLLAKVYLSMINGYLSSTNRSCSC